MFQKLSLFFVIVIAFILGVLSTAVFLPYLDKEENKVFFEKVFNQPKQSQKSASLYFYPNTTRGVLGSSSSFIVLDPTIHHVTGVQIELKYNPEVVQSVKVTPVYSYNLQDYAVLFSDIDEKNGRISFAMGVMPGKQEITEKTAVLSLEYTLIKEVSAPFEIFTILEKSLVTDKDRNDSVLKSTTNLSISP